jgi:hypothetical protein
MHFMSDTENDTGMQPEVRFTLTIEAQDMRVRYRPDYFTSADYGHFEFRSPHEPARRIPVSETGYCSHFSPMWQIREAPSVEEYARAVALLLMRRRPEPDDGEADELADDRRQLALF